MSEARHVPNFPLRDYSNSQPLEHQPSDRFVVCPSNLTASSAWQAPEDGVAVYPLARGNRWRDTEIARWATGLVHRLGLPTDPIGRGVELDGDDLTALQGCTQGAFVRPVYRIILHQPLVAFRFYGELAQPLTQLYTSLATVRQIPRFGWVAKQLLGLTGGNSAENLVAVRVEAGSQITVGGITNSATWVDQILVELDHGLTVVGHLSKSECAPDVQSKRAS